MLTTTKPNRCKHCRERMPEDKARQFLHDECRDAWITNQLAKQDAARKRREVVAARIERAGDKAKREAQKTIHQLIAEAQVAFNAFIRERDRIAGHPCISSGRPLDWSGNGVDAGHYRSTGAASHLRFDEDNCHAQSKHDNQYLAGNAVDYRLNLIKRIGLARVERLEASNEPVKWDRDTLRQIKVIYRAKLRDIKKESTK